MTGAADSAPASRLQEDASSTATPAPHPPPVTAYEIAAWIIAGVALLLVFPLHLLTALLSGLLVYELVYLTFPVLRLGKISHHVAKLLAVALLAGLIVAALTLLTWATMHFFHSGGTSLAALLQKMAEILDDVRTKLPPWLVSYLPDNAEVLKGQVVHLLRTHAGELQATGKEAGVVAAHILVGMVIGAIVSLSHSLDGKDPRPLAAALAERATRFRLAFHAVVFAQVRISALNTVFAWLYLAVILPLCGVHLPLVKTMVAITFIVGLLPVVGNLISNTVIVIVSLSFSFFAAVASLVFLVVIHKLEYFLNARIVGGRIHARTWEILVAMLVMEAAFGLSGVIAAPIYYAYLKSELADRGVV